MDAMRLFKWYEQFYDMNTSKLHEILDLSSLQHSFAVIDFIHGDPIFAGANPVFEKLLIRCDNIKIKMYQERHLRAHFHIDYGKRHHVASYAVDTGERLEGSLDKKYDRAVKDWTEKNRSQLNNIWLALQSGKLEGDDFIKELSSLRVE